MMGCFARVPDFIDSFRYLSKTTSTHVLQKLWNTASLDASERSPNVFDPAGFPVACAMARPSIMVQVLSSVVGRVSTLTPSSGSFPSAALFVGRICPAVSAMASGPGQNSRHNSFLRSISRPAYLAIRSR